MSELTKLAGELRYIVSQAENTSYKLTKQLPGLSSHQTKLTSMGRLGVDVRGVQAALGDAVKAVQKAGRAVTEVARLGDSLADQLDGGGSSRRGNSRAGAVADLIVTGALGLFTLMTPSLPPNLSATAKDRASGDSHQVDLWESAKNTGHALYDARSGLVEEKAKHHPADQLPEPESADHQPPPPGSWYGAPT